MTKDDFMECERKRLNKFQNFQLPHKFKIIGAVIFAVSFIALMSRMFISGDTALLAELSKKGLLIGMLLLSISRDKEEDELTSKLRAQSYALAFVIGVVYALVMPYVDYGLSNALKPEGEALKDLGDFQILIFMLFIQLAFYHTLKRTR